MRSTLNRFSHSLLAIFPTALAFFVPLFFLPFTADIFVFNKFYFITLLASLSLLSWCLYLLTQNKLSLTLSPSLLPFFFLIIVLFISSFWLSPIRHQSLFGLTSLFSALFIIFLTTTSSQKTQELPQNLVYASILSVSLLNLFSVLHYFGLTKYIFNSNLLDNRLFNPAGGILPALFLTFPILIGTLVYTLKIKNWPQRTLLFLASALMISGCLINISFILPKDGQNSLILLPYRASWSIAVDIFKYWGTALFGTGPETYLSAFTRLRPGYLNLDTNLWNLRFNESGSLILTLITTTGLLGGLAFIFSFLRPLFVGFQLTKQESDTSLLSFYLSSLLVFCLSFFFLPIGIVSLSASVVLLIGLTLLIKHFHHPSSSEYSLSLTTSTENSIFSTSFLPWLTTILSLALLVSYWLFAFPAYKASVLIKQASNLINSDVTGSFLKQTNASKTDPYNPNYQIILSQTYQNVARYYLTKENATEQDRQNAIETMQRAIDAGKLAARLDPLNVTVWENLANIYASFIGAADGASNLALSHLAQAVTLDPTNPRLRLQMGLLYFNLGDFDQAMKLINQTLDLKQNWDLPYYNMSALYKTRKEYTKALQYLRTGLTYTDTKSPDLEKIQEEIKTLEKLQPVATVSGQIQK